MEASEALKSPAEEAAATLTDEDRGPRRTATADALKARALHKDVILPSGAIVDLKVPNLALLIKTGKIPNELIDVAIKVDQAEAITRELILETWEFTEQLIPHTLISPVVSPDDVADLDPLDIELLMNIATRRTDIDAVGRQLGGLETQDSFREFRAQSDLRAVLGGL